MTCHLPDRLDLLATADAGRELRGCMKLASMPRLVPALLSTDGDLQVSLELGKAPDGTRYLCGTIRGDVQLQCQRCLEPMSLALDLGFRLGIVRDQQGMDALHERYEPLLVGAEPACLADIVTDEVLLALPLVPAHADSGECHRFVQDYLPPEPAKREGPFAVLAELKQKT
jgi:DUF177 domain-containing protein